MNKSLWIASALAAAVTLPALAASAAEAGKNEKCYGVVKAGHNDCQTANGSCAGTSKVDNQKDAWIYLPAGVCAKLASGSLEPKK